GGSGGGCGVAAVVAGVGMVVPAVEYDSFASQDFFRDDDLPSHDNEDKVFKPGILIQEKSVKIITRVAQEKKLAISYASLVFDVTPPNLHNAAEYHFGVLLHSPYTQVTENDLKRDV
nr:hypothetical protein [Tanacetum cinerariifolium]